MTTSKNASLLPKGGSITAQSFGFGFRRPAFLSPKGATDKSRLINSFSSINPSINAFILDPFLIPYQTPLAAPVLSCFCNIELVAHPMHRLDPTRVVRIRLDLRA